MYKKTFILLCLAISLNSYPTPPRRHQLPADDDMLLFWKLKKAPPCVPFSAFYMDCNKCVCAADGSTSCTTVSCDKVEEFIGRPPPESNYVDDDNDRHHRKNSHHRKNDKSDSY